MKIEKKYSYTDINWILLPDLLESLINSIPEKELLEGEEKKYASRLRFEVHSFDEEFECHFRDEFLQLIDSLKRNLLKVVVAIECYYMATTVNPYRTSPDFFQFRWSLKECSVIIERNTFLNGSIQIKKLEDVLQLKKLQVQINGDKEVFITKRKRTAFVAHSFDSIGESYAFNLIKFLSHLNFEISTGAGYSPEKVSNKVRRRLSEQEIVIAIVSEKLDNTWLVQESAGADFIKKPLFLCIEEGVVFTSGILGDHEYIKFSKGGIAQTFTPILEGLIELGFTFT